MLLRGRSADSEMKWKCCVGILCLTGPKRPESDEPFQILVPLPLYSCPGERYGDSDSPRAIIWGWESDFLSSFWRNKTCRRRYPLRMRGYWKKFFVLFLKSAWTTKALCEYLWDMLCFNLVIRMNDKRRVFGKAIQRLCLCPSHTSTPWFGMYEVDTS